MNKKVLFFTSVFTFLLTMVSCNNDAIFLEYQTIDDKGWCKDSLVTFDVNVTDTIGDYDVIVNIRNRNEYSYQNLYLFISSTSPKNVMVHDTLNCILADNQGNWYGSGIGSISNLPILYMSKIKFPQAGIYHFEIKQGMRESVLEGINDIGLKVKPSENEQK